MRLQFFRRGSIPAGGAGKLGPPVKTSIPKTAMSDLSRKTFCSVHEFLSLSVLITHGILFS
jgi:hypothetical protein